MMNLIMKIFSPNFTVILDGGMVEVVLDVNTTIQVLTIDSWSPFRLYPDAPVVDGSKT